jgi:hypothetical protein
MKRRFGFVSNSSSSSFILFYEELTEGEKIDILYSNNFPKLESNEKIYIESDMVLSEGIDIFELKEEYLPLNKSGRQSWCFYKVKDSNFIKECYGDFIITPEMVGLKLMAGEVDYRIPNDLDSFLYRYGD